MARGAKANQNPVTDLLKKKRKQKRTKRFKRIMCLLIILGFVTYLSSGVSKIDEINITGNELVSTDDILKYSGLIEGQSIDVFTRTGAIKDAVLNIAGIKEVSIKRNYTGTVSITVIEDSVIGYHTYEKQTGLVTLSGEVVFSNQNIDKYGNQPMLKDFDKEHLEQFAKQYALIPTQVRNLISDIAFVPQSGDQTRCEFYMDDGKVVIVRIEDMASQLAGDNYAKMIRLMPDNKYYDLLGKYSYVFD